VAGRPTIAPSKANPYGTDMRPDGGQHGKNTAKKLDIHQKI
jgi:hypothetical protein